MHTQPQRSSKKLFGVVVLNAVITLSEFIGGVASGSLSLVSDAFHNLSDTLAIIFSYGAQKMAQKEANEKHTYGYQRLEILSAFINSFILIILSLFLAVEAFKRFNSPEKINSHLMLIVAVIGLLANLFSTLLLRQEADENLNIKSSYLHLLSDTLSSISVIIGAILIRFFDIYWIDPVITLIISIYILIEAIMVIKKAAAILIQSAPAIDYEKMEQEIEAIDGVKDVHHVHIWQYSEKIIIFDGHIDFEDQLLSEIEKIYPRIISLLKLKYGITHVTIQAETKAKDQKKLIFLNKDESY
ncbi:MULTISPECIES: cation diffusion facilitator family transporter [Enterococcus]|uniref:cation diffusion facilitator family transporter n=1 Tax=Enterococcus TaxID=1350 RepID=UPI00064C53EC|nr:MULTISPECIES: cation diffusion facilitator family transporter [Enterococcus]MDQ8263806.1 cation diffusion facilitator family transporter [Enterococcus faecium]MDQ8508820.1 cation diffusion facilitator family transporter [Enterococcus faecium]MDT6267540.1 cation diffusion facilitator family transporter [Enterococcus faecium]MDW7898283.1 cation diffusion facilitator family transporter [Enterococcus faecium]NTQ67505.1 cation transporter [Enterococcus faecium]